MKANGLVHHRLQDDTVDASLSFRVRVYTWFLSSQCLEFSSNVLDEEEDEYEPFQAPDPSPSKRLRRSR